MTAAVLLTGCQGARSGPSNPRALAPAALVAQDSGPAGDYTIWAFRTSDGQACYEVASTRAQGGVCDPSGGAPTGSGIARSDRGVIVDGSTDRASAVTLVVRDASGATASVPLIAVGPTLPGVKVAVANLPPAANPVSVDFVDAAGATVASMRLSGDGSAGGGAVQNP